VRFTPLNVAGARVRPANALRQASLPGVGRAAVESRWRTPRRRNPARVNDGARGL